MNDARWNRTPLLGLILAAAALACTAEDPQVSSVGAVALYAVNPSIRPQRITVSPGAVVDGNLMQTAIWEITRAEIFIGDDTEGQDLLFDGDECLVADTPLSSTVSIGDCIEFLVLESFDENDAVQATLRFSFQVRLKRVNPPAYPLIGDFDGDGVLNGNDNCVLIPNPDQDDTGGFNFGDACRVHDVFSGPGLDSDADGITDILDNCVHIANPLQVNPPSEVYSEIESIVSDGIGLACEPTMPGSSNTSGFEEQIVDLGPFADQVVTFDFVLPQAEGFVVVDFDDERVFLDCVWDMGAMNTCTFDPNAVRVCIATNAALATLGCP